MQADGGRGRSVGRAVAGALSAALLIALGAAGPAAAGQLYGWGMNASEQLANGSGSANTSTPTPVDSLTEVSAFAAGGTHGYAVTPTGPLAWGNNNYGELDLGIFPGPEECPPELQSFCSKTPRPMVGLEGATQIAAGGAHGLARLESGKVLAWGENEEGQLGDGTNMGPERCEKSFGGNWCSKNPIEVPGISEAVYVSAGVGNSFAVLADGTVMAWGFDSQGDLGDGGTGRHDVPFVVPGVTGVKAVAAGKAQGSLSSSVTVALLGDGQVMTWGSTSKAPALVSGISGATAVAAGSNFGLALLEDGHVMTFKQATSPSEVPGLSNATAISAGGLDGFAVLESGRVMGWGTSEGGSLGNGGGASPEPGNVCGLTGVTKIDSGGAFSYAYSPNPETIPEVMGISPNHGAPLGGTTVTISGPNLEGATSVKFGATEASFTVKSPTSIEAIAPAGEDGGTVPVTVTSPAGTSVTCNADRYEFKPPTTITSIAPHIGSADTPVTITGTGFSAATSVDFGATPAAAFTIKSSTAITATPPAGVLGTVDITVNTAEGSNVTGPADRITLNAPPEYGRCVKVTSGGSYGLTTCVSTTSSNKYEWLPAFGGSGPLVKAGFTTVIKPTTKLVLTTSAGHVISCTGAAGSGTFTGLGSTSLSLVLTGCSMGANSCQSAEAAPGEVRPGALSTELGVAKAGTEAKKNQLGLDFHPTSGETIASFTCGSTSVVLSGSVVATVAATNSMTTKQTQKFAATKSVQKPQRLEGGPEAVLHATIGEGAPEVTGLVLTLVQVSEEKVEISSVI
jgi:alpha-tubulin suppressor-like RCC1 family protein